MHDFMSLTETELSIVSENPFGALLNEARDGLLQAEGERGADQQRSRSTSANHDEATPEVCTMRPKFERVYAAAIKLLFDKLITSIVSLSLSSRAGNDALASDLLAVRLRLNRSELDYYERFRLLSRLVIDQASDTEIWAAVIDLVIDVSTPTQNVTLREDTPFTISSASLQGSEQTRYKVEERMLDELRHCTFENVEGFHNKYFIDKSWSKKADKTWKTARKRHCGRWSSFPEKLSQDNVYRWWISMSDTLLSKAKSAYYRSHLTNLIGDEAKRRVDIVVRKRAAGISDEEHKWKDVLVVGELKSSMYDWRGTLLQLGCYVREVFSHQPRRRFVHAFALYGAQMETWIFDRSGAYSAKRFDINLEPERFIQVLCGYVMMSDEELGLDTLVDSKANKLSVILSTDGGKKRKLELEPNPIAHQRAIVCRGTACYLAKTASRKVARTSKRAATHDSVKKTSSFESVEPNCVVKFSWTSDKRQPEWRLLETAHERGVKGVAKLVGHAEVTNISQLREGLNFEASKKHRFQGMAASNTSVHSHTRSQSQSAVLQGLSIHERKRKSVEVLSSTSKRSRLDSLRNELSGSTEAPDGSSLMRRNSGEELFDNRVFRVLAISPAGKSIRQFTSSTELLEALRDAIKAHRSLYTDGSILHRDISENNIIITNPADSDGLSGMLIDLDLAKKLGEGRSGARHRTGTMQFMAIEVLEGRTHTYRHDLESFFYVLVWLSVRRAWELPGVGKPPRGSALVGWYTGTYTDMLKDKTADMDKKRFKAILDEIPNILEAVKPLCSTLRDMLFPYRDGLFTGTPSDPESLYGPMIKAFEDALSNIRQAA